MIVGKTATGQSSTSLKILWKLVEAEGCREKIPTLKIGNVKCGRAPSVSYAVNVESNLPHLHSRLKRLFQLDTQQDDFF